MKSKWHLTSYGWRVTRRTGIVLGIIAAVVLAGHWAYARSIASQTAESQKYPVCRMSYAPTDGFDSCKPNTTFAWMDAGLTILVGLAVLLALVVIAGALIQYIFGPDNCRGCSCKDHRRRVVFDGSGVAVSTAALAVVIATTLRF